MIAPFPLHLHSPRLVVSWICHASALQPQPPFWGVLGLLILQTSICHNSPTIEQSILEIVSSLDHPTTVIKQALCCLQAYGQLSTSRTEELKGNFLSLGMRVLQVIQETTVWLPKLAPSWLLACQESSQKANFLHKTWPSCTCSRKLASYMVADDQKGCLCASSTLSMHMRECPQCFPFWMTVLLTDSVSH